MGWFKSEDEKWAENDQEIQDNGQCIREYADTPNKDDAYQHIDVTKY